MKCLCGKCTVKHCDKKINLAKRLQGKKNRNSGRYAEKKLKALFGKWDIKIEPTISSGSLKQVTGKVKNQKYLFSGDFYSSDIIKGTRLKIECKKKQYSVFKRYYELVNEYDSVWIKGFCILINQDNFKDLINKALISNPYCVEDKQFKGLHKFFDQDNADMVAMISPNPDTNRYNDFIFAIKENLFKKLIERGK